MKTKYGKLRIDRVLLVFVGLILSFYLINGIIVEIKYQVTEYEFETEYITGIGTQCGMYTLGKESCLVGHLIIPVKQYSEIRR